MHHPLRLLAIFLTLALLLPSAVMAEEETKGDEPAPAPAPAPEPEPDASPDETEPSADAPDAPDPDAPAPDAPADEPAKEDPKPKPKPSDTQAAPPAAVPAGMAYVEGGRVFVGSEAEYLDGLLAGRPPLIKKLFLYETPYHSVFLRPYFIGLTEVSNAQYHRHLQDYLVEYDTASGSLANVDEISAHLVGLPDEVQKDTHQAVWSQFYFANKDLIWKAFEKRLAEFQVRRADGTIDERATAKKFRFQPLPRTLKLKFYSIRLPQNWPSMDPPEGEKDHPVRYVNYNDAERFAEWAGVHIPSEEQWEWAARGPDARYYPWGNDWPRTEVYANWGGKLTKAYETTTAPVANRAGSNPEGKLKDDEGRLIPIDGDGRSWVGCHHMLGNVAEWTSSWFEPYPGNKHHQNFMGRWVKVIRGGSAADLEMIALRPACRNWIGGGPDAPPYPDAYFKWAGFRVASYMKSGRDQLSPIVRRAVRPKKIYDSELDLDRFVGSVTRSWVEPDAVPENHVYVLGRSNSVVVLPIKSYLREQGMEQMRKAWKRPMKTAKSIAKKASEEHPFWIVGVLHTDIRLDPVLVRKVEVTEPGDKKKKKKKGRRRGRAKAPETQEGVCEPGTYLIGNWFGRLALLTPGKEFVCFIPKPDKKFKPFEVKKLDAEERTDPTLLVDPELDRADFEFDIALGGKSVSDEMRLITRGRLQFDVGSLESAGTWVQEDPARGLTRVLLDAFRTAEEKAAAEAPKKKKPDSKKKKPDEGKKKDDAKKKDEAGKDDAKK